MVIFEKWGGVCSPNDECDCLSDEDLNNWYHEIADGKILTDVDNKSIIFDYEVAEKIKEHLEKGFQDYDVSQFVESIQISSPYILIRGRLRFNYIITRLCLSEDSVNSTYDDKSGETLFIINCRDIYSYSKSGGQELSREAFSKDFLSFILKLGNCEYDIDIDEIDDKLINFNEQILGLLEGHIHDETLVITDFEDRQIAIAIDEYVENAKEVIGRALNLNTRMLVEVSTPFSTILVIDCEKVFVAKEYYDMDELEWLY